MTEVMPRCHATRTDGDPCLNPNVQRFGDVWACPFHLPAGARWLRAKDQPNPAMDQGSDPEPDPLPNDGRLETVEDVRALMQWAVQQLVRGTITEAQSRGVVNGAKAFLQVLKDDHEKRVAELEDAIKLKRYGAGKLPT